AVPEIPVLDDDAVLGAVSASEAIECVRAALIRFHQGQWTMPPKVYLESPPFGDFRAMPALGDGLALLKWITSFPGNPARGRPTAPASATTPGPRPPKRLRPSSAGAPALARTRWAAKSSAA